MHPTPFWAGLLGPRPVSPAGWSWTAHCARSVRFYPEHPALHQDGSAVPVLWLQALEIKRNKIQKRETIKRKTIFLLIINYCFIGQDDDYFKIICKTLPGCSGHWTKKKVTGCSVSKDLAAILHKTVETPFKLTLKILTDNSRPFFRFLSPKKIAWHTVKPSRHPWVREGKHSGDLACVFIQENGDIL